MPVEEPATPSGFWPLVKSGTEWPDTDEDAVDLLSGSWDQAAGTFGDVAKTDVNPLRTAWGDDNGEQFLVRARELFDVSEQTQQNMREFARETAEFATDVRDTKNAIREFVLTADARFVEFGSLAPEIGVPLQQDLVNQTAAEINRYLGDMAGKVAAGSSVLLSPVGPGGAPPALPAGPPPGATPEQVNQWWNGLSEAERAAVLRHAPDTVRNLDGIPAVVRDAANREVLVRDRAALEARSAELTRMIDEERVSPNGENPNHVVEKAEIDAKIHGLNMVEQRLVNADSDLRPAYLLGLDTAEDGKIVVARGNPDTAANIATFVPGMTSDIATIGGNLDVADSIAGEAGGSTSVVTWLGYDAPDGVGGAASPSYADGGKGAFNDFQDGLRATHEGPRSLNTVIGHSYGTTLVGHTARDLGLNADAVALVASPGAGVDHVSDLRLDGVSEAEIGRRVHASTALNDVIEAANPSQFDFVHGPSPAQEEFGGTVFQAAPGSFFNPVGAHNAGEYFKEAADGNADSPTLDYVGDLVAGRSDD